MEQENLTAAERMYRNHLQNCKNYHKRNPEIYQLKNKKRREKHMNDTAAYELFKEKARESSKAYRERQKLKKLNN